MDKSTRIRVIQATRDALLALQWEDADLALKEFGWAGMPDSTDYDPSVSEVLRGGQESDLLALASHLAVEASMTSDLRETRTAATGTLVVFASHLAREKAVVGAVEAELSIFGTRLFVAHTAIDPDRAWRDEILKTLDEAHAGVAFIHAGFKESEWCDQEVGWLLGRRVPVFSLQFDRSPHGPLGERQAITAGHLTASEMADAILDVVIGRPELHGHLAMSLATGLVESPNFRTTDRVWERLRNLRNLGEAQCELLMTALEQNQQVARARGPWPASALDGNEPYALVIPRFLEQQPGVHAIRERLGLWAAGLEAG